MTIVALLIRYAARTRQDLPSWYDRGLGTRYWDALTGSRPRPPRLSAAMASAAMARASVRASHAATNPVLLRTRLPRQRAAAPKHRKSS